MAFTPDQPFPKAKGHVIKSKDWNDTITEMQRLDNAKVNKAGDAMSGPLTVSGNVGIGTEAPLSRLQVGSLTAIDEGATDAGAWTNLGSNAFYDGDWKRIDTTKAGVNLHMNADSGGEEFRFLRVEANGTERNIAHIGSSTSFIAEGNVGIGTINPGARLEVNGDISISGKHAFRGNDPWLRLNQDGAFAIGVHTPGLFAPGSLNVGGVGGWGNPGEGNVWIAGSVGIGTASPQVRLHTVGNRIRLDNGAGLTLDLRADGSALDLESNGADLFINNNNLPVHIPNLAGPSSRDLKENITDFTVREAMEALNGLNPVFFNWRDDEEKNMRLGFIAEDTPGVATDRAKTAILPTHILAILSKVVREQQRTIDSMCQKLRLRDDE